MSEFADKTLKSLLHLAAMTTIQRNNVLREYYLRKINEGKNKMSVLNAVRNKIIHRVYAVIKKSNFLLTKFGFVIEIRVTYGETRFKYNTKNNPE